MKFCDIYIGDKCIAKRVKYCNTFGLKLLGLMFVKTPGHGAFLPDVKDIHMNFVRFNLRIVWLDKNYKVLHEKIARRWRLYYGPEEAKHVLELPEDSKAVIKIGQKLNLKIYESKDKS
ncbi:MAG: DUF192 domain-containing protein [Candidatus Parvarchaeota archaeon]|jgi:uncharacterized membrane protein (UPF0127 family)|nr:DUF192 domain-containing protein [Candidatus Parvarchaeota archaeon]